MATILVQPGSLAMAGNISDIILTSPNPIDFRIKVGGEVLLYEKYSTGDQYRIQIRLRDLLPTLLQLNFPSGDIFSQQDAVKDFEFVIDNSITIHSRVILAGVDADVNAELFLKANWLTWQPQQKLVKYNAPEWLSYYAVENSLVKVKAYFADKTTKVISLHTIPAGTLQTLNMSYAHLSGKFIGQPVYFDVWTERNGVQLSFVQRYVLTNEYYDYDDFFVFANTLGGIDTIRFTGEKQEKNEWEIESALFDEDTQDYDIDFTQIFKKNTGYFTDESTRLWTNEFFNSTFKYYAADSGYQSITVSKPKAETKENDLSTQYYEFEFALSRQTKYLNLSRTNELPSEIAIVDPDSELFFLAPRLSEFPGAILNSELLIPVQIPFSEEWKITSYGAIRSNILSEVVAMGFVIGGDVGNHIDLSKYALLTDLHEHANKELLDSLALDGNYLERNEQEIWVANTDRLGNLAASSYWTKQELINDALYLKVGANKIKAGFADLAYDSDRLGNILAADHWNKYNSNLPNVDWVMNNAIFHGDWSTAAFAQGIAGGVGAKIDQSGHGEMKSLDLREFLRTPELIKNQVRVAGNQFWFTDPGLIKEVSGTGPYVLTLKIEESDNVSFRTGDILIGIYNHDTGFETCYLDVISVDLENDQITVNSRNGISPRKFMQLARKGNLTNADRQTSVYVDGLNGFVRVLGDVNNHDTNFDNVIAQLGFLNLTSPVFGLMEKGLYVKDFGYFENVRVSGEIHVTGGNAETKEGAQAKVDNINIGGRNLFLDSSIERSTTRFLKISVHDIFTGNMDREVSISFDMKCSVSRAIKMYAYQENGICIADSGYFTVAEENVFERFSLTTKVKDFGDNGIHSDGEIGFYDQVGNQNFTIKNIKIEWGNKPTDWTPAPEDVEATIATAQTAAETAAALAALKVTAEEATVITQNTITTQYIAALGLKVGDEILMGENAVITWANVTGTENIETKSGAQEKANTAQANATAVADTAQTAAETAAALAALKVTAEEATVITKNTITTQYIAALGLKVGDEILMGEDAIISWENVIGGQEAIDAIQIGSVNLFCLSKLNSISINGGSEIIGSNFDRIFKANNSGYWAILPISNPNPLVKKGEIVTISFEYRRNSIDSFGFEITGTSGVPTIIHGLKKLPENNTDDWKVYTETIVANYTDAYPFGGINLWGVGEIRRITIVAGEKFTGLFPAPADIDANLATKTTAEQVTTITKNTVTTQYIAALGLKVGDEILMGEDAIISWENVLGGQEAIDAIQIGSVNLFCLSKLNSISINDSSAIIGSGFDRIFKANRSGDWAILPISNPNPLVKKGEVVTISFEYRRNSIDSFGFEITGTSSTPTIIHGLKKLPENNTDAWKIYTETVVANYTDAYPFGGINLWGVGEIRRITIVSGEKFTGLFPAPADIDANIATKTTAEQVTTITKDTIATVNIIAQNLQIYAGKIIGQLEANQINFNAAIGRVLDVKDKFRFVNENGNICGAISGEWQNTGKYSYLHIGDATYIELDSWIVNVNAALKINEGVAITGDVNLNHKFTCDLPAYINAALEINKGVEITGGTNDEFTCDIPSKFEDTIIVGGLVLKARSYTLSGSLSTLNITGYSYISIYAPSSSSDEFYLLAYDKQNGRTVVIFNRNDDRTMYIKQDVLDDGSNYPIPGGTAVTLVWDTNTKYGPTVSGGKWIVVSRVDQSW